MSIAQLELLIEPLRTGYLNHLRASIVAARLKHPDLVTELALKVNGEAWNERLLLTRIDMVWDEGGDPQLANAELDPIGTNATVNFPNGPGLDVDGVFVAIHEFRWNSCAIQLTPSPQSWEPIWDWFDRWFDIEDLNLPDADGFCSSLHGISHSERNAGTCHLVVDFGTTPTTAMLEFMNACRTAGVTHLAIG